MVRTEAEDDREDVAVTNRKLAYSRKAMASNRSQISEADTEDLMIEADVNVGLNHLNVSDASLGCCCCCCCCHIFLASSRDLYLQICIG